MCVCLPLVQISPWYVDSSRININDLIDDLILTIFTKTLFPNKAIFYSTGC